MKCSDCNLFLDDLLGDGGIGICCSYKDDHLVERDKEILTKQGIVVCPEFPKQPSLYPHADRNCKYFDPVRSQHRNLQAVCKGLGVDVDYALERLNKEDIEDINSGEIKTRDLRFILRTIILMDK